MKKTSIILLLVLIIAELFVACNGDAVGSMFNEKGEELPDYFGFTARVANSSVALKKTRTPTDISLLYSTDGKEWVDYEIGTVITMTNADDKVYFIAKEKMTTFCNYSDYYSFSSEGQVDVKGNIMYLLNPQGENTLMPDHAFAHLFKDNRSLISAKDLLLPAETLSGGCYFEMFYNCTSLTDAPELNATKLSTSCYHAMFTGCTSLTKAPDLPATTLSESCYESMFWKCSSLTEAPVFGGTVKANLKNDDYAKVYADHIFDSTQINRADFSYKCFNYN